MIAINNFIDEIIATLKANNFFDDISVIRAYPSNIRETKLSKIVIAVGIGDLEAQPEQIDYITFSGDIAVAFNIYAPLKADDRCFYNILNNICTALEPRCIVKIAADKIKINSNIQAYELNTAITFRDELSLGGADDE